MAQQRIKLTQIQDDRTWHAVARSMDTIYTNSNSYPIEINASIDLGNGTAGRQARLFVGGELLGDVYLVNATNSARAIMSISATVPAGATYSITTIAGAPSVFRWAELY